MSWRDETWIGFDTETTGKYPLSAEICEIGAVKWKRGQVVDRYNQLIRPSEPMGAEVIKIHNITNEMVADAPRLSDVIEDFYNFIQDGVLVAHHAPFDMGFLTYEFEKHKLPLPVQPVVCSSLYSRNTLAGVENYRLQTLVSHFNLDGGQAHRATDDAEACLNVLLLQLEKNSEGKELSLQDVYKSQGRKLNWFDYSIEHLRQFENTLAMVEALEKKLPLDMVYKGGSRPGKSRQVFPIGLVRNPNGDFLVASDNRDSEEPAKRFYLNRIKEACVPTDISAQ